MRHKSEILYINIFPEKDRGGISLSSVEAFQGRGLKGDHYCSKPDISFSETRRGSSNENFKGNGDAAAIESALEVSNHNAVTLQDIDDIKLCNREMGTAFEPDAFRRNIITTGLSLNDLVGNEFYAGNVLMKGYELCQPCRELTEKLHPDLMKAMWNRGGLRAWILSDGEIKVGDKLGLRCISFSSDNEDCFRSALKIRTEVFVKEQNVSPELEYDGQDIEARHYLIFKDSTHAVGTARTRITDKGVKLERFALLKEYRKLGLGRSLLNFIHENLDNPQKIYFNAQTTAVSFYEKMGYVKAGDPFFEAGIEHYRMIKANK